MQPGVYSNRMKHLRRWETVKLLRLHGFKTPEVFESAKAYLKGSFAGNVESKAIQASYYKVENALKDPQKKFEYYKLSTATSEITNTPPVKFPKN